MPKSKAYLVASNDCDACREHIDQLKKEKKPIPKLIVFEDNEKLVEDLGIDQVPQYISTVKKGKKTMVCKDGNDKKRSSCILVDSFKPKTKKTLKAPA